MSLTRNCFTWIMTAAMLVSTAVPTLALDKGAKGLFFEQLDSPSKDLNTGVQYWIELERDGETIKTNNKAEFRSGDRIRFRVKSNIKGYAYILLTTGSRGEQSVLFPDPSVNESNKVLPGKTYTLPGMGSLTFDENPGMEKVTLLLSRHPIDAQAYLDKPTEQPTLIASAMTGSKDLVPAKVLVSYADPNKSFPGSSLKVARSTVKSEPVKTEKPATTTTTKVAHTSTKTKKNSASSGTSSTTANKVAQKPTKKNSPVSKPKTKPNKVSSPATEQDDESVTVVSQATDGILHVDVNLHHI
ncbi:MAG: DUF4384 domain-containing protein [Cyanobacteriota/Melainabacteria group bacterium]|nr:DUF4384 domain-containing protein [Candidatus Obscuribacterales bacterium]